METTKNTGTTTKAQTIFSKQSYLRLLIIFIVQFGLLWLVSKIFPDTPCGVYAASDCKPQATTEAQMLRLFLPIVFIPIAVIQFRYIVVWTRTMQALKKIAIIFSSTIILVVMLVQLMAAIGALLGRWLG